LLEAISMDSSRCTVLDHESDLALGTGNLSFLALGAVMALHQTWVGNTIIGGWDTGTSLSLLHDDGENESRVNTR